jgi:hypothetical protein
MVVGEGELLGGQPGDVLLDPLDALPYIAQFVDQQLQHAGHHRRHGLSADASKIAVVIIGIATLYSLLLVQFDVSVAIDVLPLADRACVCSRLGSRW